MRRPIITRREARELGMALVVGTVGCLAPWLTALLGTIGAGLVVLGR